MKGSPSKGKIQSKAPKQRKAAEIRRALLDKSHPDHPALMKLLTKAVKALAPHVEELRRWTAEINEANQEAGHLLALFKERGLQAIAALPPVKALTVIAMLAIDDEEIRSEARKAVAINAAEARHHNRKQAKAFVKKEWTKLNADGIRVNKAAFIRRHVVLVKEKFDIAVSDKVMRERWFR